MSDDASELERLPSTELHERAVALARHRWDIRFFWRLLEAIPAAEAAAGNLDASDASIAQASGLVQEALSAEDDPGVQEALRPLYIDYLTRHGEEGTPGGTERGEGEGA
ncbi:hypothetical protein ACFO4E_29845 [Nocardiopsis mangrovi]|uniref:Uncharacterized protein n=1 Tax=Nocardiopsis mangrovi TaxID=1179818 RepID=A0ABV9E674_9ACTN